MTQTESASPPRSEATEPVVGQPIDRVDGTAKTTGAARFSAEYPYPDLAHAALVHAPSPAAGSPRSTRRPRPPSPGVIAVITHRERAAR